MSVHVEVQVMHVPKPLKGIPYTVVDQGVADRRLAKVGDRFDLDLHAAQAQARKGHVRILGPSKAQAKSIAAKRAREIESAQSTVEKLKAELAAAEKAAAAVEKAKTAAAKPKK